MKFVDSREVGPKENYSYVTRKAIELFDEGALGNVQAVRVEPEYGYCSQIVYLDGSTRVTYGNDLGLNIGSAEGIAKDKGHTKSLLRTLGVDCPKGEEFLLPWWAEKIGPSQNNRGNLALRTTDLADEYIEQELGYPVYVKPAHGSQGSGVNRVEAKDELNDIFQDYGEDRVSVAIVEEEIQMPDYRIVVLDNELVSAYRRVPLAVMGDGSKTIDQLIDQQQNEYLEQGRDTIIDKNDQRIKTKLLGQGLDFGSVPASDSSVVLASVSNLSMGGTSEDVTEIISQRWVDLAKYVRKNFSLRLCGVDLACEDIADPDSGYSVLEVNSTPGLDHYASSGAEQEAIVKALYAKVLNALPS